MVTYFRRHFLERMNKVAKGRDFLAIALIEEAFVVVQLEFYTWLPCFLLNTIPVLFCVFMSFHREKDTIFIGSFKRCGV